MANPKPKRTKHPTLAEQADRHRLYELSVQNPEAEITFIDAAFRALRRRRARLLREDFCGTAAVSCEWVRLRPTNRAIGVDLDPEVLTWGREHNLSELPAEAAERVELIQSDVLKVSTEEPPDVIAAMNFSYWLFKERKQLKRYFRRAREGLAEGGILFLDAYGGYDSYREITEERELDGFTYIWDQAKFEPIRNGLICHIHFSFPDGSRLERAFSYDWRLWTLPEIRELLEETGFRQVTVYWQGYDEDGEPDGVFVPVGEGEADAGWICYLTAEK
jgi:cyclopropane fatty-acyl-phospholipid synthase-like methyltransferase